MQEARPVKASRLIVLCAALVSFSMTSRAQSLQNLYVTAGWFHLAPQDSSSPLTVKSINGMPVNIEQPNTGASASSGDTFGAVIGYYLTSHIAAELEVGIPPKFDLSGTGSFAQYGKIGSAKQWSPALIFKYVFFEPQAKFRPYIGLGVTHTSFSDLTITNTDFETNALHGSTTGDASSSWAPIFNIGFNYAVTEHWFGVFSLSFIPLHTTGTFTTTIPTQRGPVTTTSQAKLTLNPIVISLRVGYRF